MKEIALFFLGFATATMLIEWRTGIISRWVVKKIDQWADKLKTKIEERWKHKS